MIKIDQENKKSLNTNAEDELFFLLLLERELIRGIFFNLNFIRYLAQEGLEENQQYSREYSPINIANNFSYLLTTEEFINDEENNLDLLEEKKFWSEFGKLNYCDNL